MMQQHSVATRGLVAMSGMKTAAEWQGMSHAAKAEWLGALSPIGQRAQASVTAAASRRSVEAVILAWVIMGLLSDDDALHALAAAPDEVPA